MLAQSAFGSHSRQHLSARKHHSACTAAKRSVRRPVWDLPPIQPSRSCLSLIPLPCPSQCRFSSRKQSTQAGAVGSTANSVTTADQEYAQEEQGRNNQPDKVEDAEEYEELDTENPRAPDALPSLPKHLQHMEHRPWVVAMQLRWIRKNLEEEKHEKVEYVEQLQQQLTHTKFARTALDSHAGGLQNDIAGINRVLASIDDMLGELTQTECWRPH